MIQIEGLTYTYPLTLQPALEDITLTIPRGQFCAIVGANGAGKSSLCYALSGYIPHFYRGKLEGRVVLDDRVVADTPLYEMPLRAGLVFQNPFNQISGARFTVREEIAFGLENMGVPRAEMIERVEEAMRITRLTATADRSPMTLSGGQQQRLALASVMVMRPPVLVLDEPTSQLDPVGVREVFSTLSALAASGDVTVVMAEHRLEWIAAFADRVIALQSGRVLADGSPQEVLTDPEVIESGVGATQYTQAARLAQQRGFADGLAALPVTLNHAADFFRAARGRK